MSDSEAKNESADRRNWLTRRDLYFLLKTHLSHLYNQHHQLTKHIQEVEAHVSKLDGVTPEGL